MADPSLLSLWGKFLFFGIGIYLCILGLLTALESIQSLVPDFSKLAIFSYTPGINFVVAHRALSLLVFLLLVYFIWMEVVEAKYPGIQQKTAVQGKPRVKAFPDYKDRNELVRSPYARRRLDFSTDQGSGFKFQ